MEKNESIDIQTLSYIERPSKKIIDSLTIKVSDPNSNHIECIEIVQRSNSVSCDQGKLILTLRNSLTHQKIHRVISFSLFITNKPTKENGEDLR